MNGVFENINYYPLSCRRVNGFQGYIPMFHTHGELVYVVEGSISITVDGEEHTLCAGELGVLFPYLTHSYEDAPGASVIILLFDPAATAFDNTLLTQKPACWYREGRQFQPLLDRAVTMYFRGRTKTAVAYLNAVLGELLDILELEKRDRSIQDIAVRLLSYCEEHCAEQITVKSIADALYISQSYVSKIFSQKLRYGFREYINALRVQKAGSLLRDTDKKILQIMLECGFQNQSSFNRVFREVTGYSPREYRAIERRRADKVGKREDV